MLEQWKGELEDRFGLVFEILDRAYLTRMRRERGFGVNPWMTHSRFLVSHNLLIDPGYADPMRAWLGPLRPGSLLILDEAHHAAPSSGGRYGIESKFTRAVRDLAGRFEHRLFLSATPHNGHSNSFSTLLELLDPYRFTRGVKVRGRKALEDVMVRRLKEDIRVTQGGFPERRVERVVIDGLPADAPELALSRLLDEYRTAREARHANASGKAQAAAGLLVVGLQQRLLSSVEAFARSLAVHRRTVERHWEREQEQAEAGKDETRDSAVSAGQPPPREATATGPPRAPEAAATGKSRAPEAVATGQSRTPEVAASPDDEHQLFLVPPAADDERGEQDPELAEAEEEAQIEAITEAAESGAPDRGAAQAELWRREQALLDRMETIAERTRHVPDAKTRQLVDWIRERMCPELPPFGQSPQGRPPRWNDRRVLVFTENREGTKRYLRNILDQAIAGTDRADERIEVIDGLTQGARRKEIQRRFNADPAADPLRILLATDAAREGLNFQAHCADLFHFDLPWNPGRIEQRNGRIDRKLQPAAEVRCHYFVLPQRVEDRVLEVLVRKTDIIKRELGSLSKVIDDDVERRLRGGIRHGDADRLKRAIEAADLDEVRRQITEDELEAARDRRDDLTDQVERCRGLLERSRTWVGFEAEPFRDALSCALERSAQSRWRETAAATRSARGGRCGPSRPSTGGRGPTRPGRPRSTPCGRRAGATRSWPTGGARRPSARWSSRTPACSATTPSTCTWSSGSSSASSPGSAPRASSTTTCRGPASPRPGTRFPGSSSSGGSASTAAEPSGCTRRSSPWRRAGSSRRGGATRSGPMPATPRRAPSSCWSSRWPAARTGRRTRSSGPGCWRPPRATSTSCCLSPSRAPTRSPRWRPAG